MGDIFPAFSGCQILGDESEQRMGSAIGCGRAEGLLHGRSITNQEMLGSGGSHARWRLDDRERGNPRRSMLMATDSSCKVGKDTELAVDLYVHVSETLPAARA